MTETRDTRLATECPSLAQGVKMKALLPDGPPARGGQAVAAWLRHLCRDTAGPGEPCDPSSTVGQRMLWAERCEGNRCCRLQEGFGLTGAALILREAR
jgi:hypothetical protein